MTQDDLESCDFVCEAKKPNTSDLHADCRPDQPEAWNGLLASDGPCRQLWSKTGLDPWYVCRCLQYLPIWTKKLQSKSQAEKHRVLLSKLSEWQFSSLSGQRCWETLRNCVVEPRSSFYAAFCCRMAHVHLNHRSLGPSSIDLRWLWQCHSCLHTGKWLLSISSVHFDG